MMTTRELSTVLAALRLWQCGDAIGDDGSPYLEAIASNGGTLKPLSNEEIDRLCETLNSGSKPACETDFGREPSDREVCPHEHCRYCEEAEEG